MKYKLINTQTKEEHLCDKVTKDGFDYYISNGVDIATTEPRIDIPQVVDEVEKLAANYALNRGLSKGLEQRMIDSFIQGYNKSQETHPFSIEDANAYADAVMSGCLLRAKEWKEQQPKVIYYN